MTSKKILHVDMDAFFASVEQRDHPELRGKPVVVGGSPNGRGVVAAASYEARRYGVRSAMAAAKAKRLCPELIFVRGRYETYAEVSRKIREIFLSYSEKIEPLSLDEAYLDVTQNKKSEPSALKLGQSIQNEILEKLNLTSSVGISNTKFVAKVASAYKKPFGLTCIPPEKVDEFLLKLPIEKYWGVGPVTTKYFKSYGIHTTADIRAWQEEAFTQKFGEFGLFIYQLAHGIDHRKVGGRSKRKSHGSESTFSKDVESIDDLSEILKSKSVELCDEISAPAQTINIKIRFSNFQTITRSKTIARPTKDPAIVFEVAQKLLLKAMENETTAVRLLGLSLSQLRNENQLWLPFPNIQSIFS